jgi:tetratricopeptide (TPR) repeat protein
MIAMQSRRPMLLAALTLALVTLALAGCGGAQARKARHLSQGESYLKQGNYEKARVEFQNSLQIAPMDPAARFETGVAFEKLGKIREAAQLYQGAIDVSPDYLEARTSLGRLLVLSSLPDRALETISPALAKHPDNSELLALRAAIYVQQKNTPAALTDAEKSVKLDPSNEDALAGLAGIYASTQHLEEARTLLESSIKRLPQTVNLRLVLAQVYSEENRREDVERVLFDLIRLQPKERAHRVRLAQFYTRQTQLDAAERVLRDAIKALPDDRTLKLALVDFLATRRSPDVAERELKSFIAAAPKDPDLKFALAKFYETTGKRDAAEGIYRQVIDQNGLDAAGLVARDRLAALRGASNDILGAQKLIAEVLAKSPRDTDALLLRGNIELSQQDPKSAITDLRAVLRDQPNSVPVMRTLARAHLANNEPALAEETMRSALELNPKDAAVRLDLAQLLAKLGKPEQAKPLLQQITMEEPGNTAALDGLFRVSAATKDYVTAKAAADGLVAAQPKSALGYLYLGLLAEQDKRPEDALRLYEQARTLQPSAAEPLEATVRLLVERKRLPEALKVLDQQITAQPTESLAAKMKGDLLLGEGHIAEAEEGYRLAINRTPKWALPYRALARAQFVSKDTQAGIATLQSALPVVDHSDEVMIDLAMYYETAERPDDAIAQYDHAIAKNPQSEVAANNLAMLLVTYRNKDTASLDRAKALVARFAESSDPAFLDTYGWVLYKHGEATASVPVLQKVVAQRPNAPVALYHLGMAESGAGESEQARHNLELAVKSGANFSGLDEARATLERLAKEPARVAAKS